MLFIFDKVDVRMGRENHNVDNYIIGTKLKEFRQQAGLSLAKVAESVGVTSAFISMVENGKCGISFQKVHALVKLYGKTLADVTSTHPLADEKVINLNAASEVAFEPGIKAFGTRKRTRSFLSWVDFACFYEPGAQHSFDHHEGMEYVLVLDGTFDIYLRSEENGSTEVRHLHAGDTTAYAAKVHHSFKNVGETCGSLLFWKSQEAKIKEKRPSTVFCRRSCCNMRM